MDPVDTKIPEPDPAVLELMMQLVRSIDPFSDTQTPPPEFAAELPAIVL